MELIYFLFGTDEHLNTLQMVNRGIVIFFITLILIRISGRRSYSFRMPLDNIIGILLGGILSRVVVGASPFISTLATCLIIVCLHRASTWLTSRSPYFNKLVEGKKIMLYEDGTFIKENMKRALVSKEDIMQNVRKNTSSESLSHIDRIYIERNGDISILKK